MESNNVTISDLAPSSLVGVEGIIVGALSLVKSSRRNKDYQYYNGSISDGVKTARFVSFELKLKKEIEKALQLH